MFSPLLLVIMALGGVVFLVGIVLSNIAVLEMSKRLNAKYPQLPPKRWWNSIGHGAEAVIQEYRKCAWSDRLPDKRLRFGYTLAAAGFATVIGASILGKYLRGSI